jgi:hypothetical protein
MTKSWALVAGYITADDITMKLIHATVQMFTLSARVFIESTLTF